MRDVRATMADDYEGDVPTHYEIMMVLGYASSVEGEAVERDDS